MTTPMPPRTPQISRRQFLATATALPLAGCAVGGVICTMPAPARDYTLIDLHQHTNYSGRTDAQLLAHQKNMGVTYTILLPAGHPVDRPATHMGKSNGLAAKCGPNETCHRIVLDHPRSFGFFANEVPDAENATRELEKYLELGALGIGEQKFNVDVESPAMAGVFDVANHFGVPVLLHFQYQTYNHGFDRFYRILERYPRVNFIAHAQTTWANIDARADQRVLYPKTPVTPGGLTDRYLRDYPNFYADLSAGSGLGALTRDEDHARAFLKIHQDKLLYGSDCNDNPGKPPACQGALTLIALKRIALSEAILDKIFRENAKRLLRLPRA